MEAAIKESFFSYLFLALFIGVSLIQLCFAFVKKIKNVENSKIRMILCVTICSAAFCFWLFFFVIGELYPISLAYSECKNGLTEETVGVIDSIEQEGKDRVRLVIKGTEYTMVYSSSEPFANIGKDIVEGDYVKISFGEKSKYLFDIYETNLVP
jgi:hypothetical protein